MTDIVITAASVLSGAGASVVPGLAGATITAGQVVYLDATTKKYLLADNNGAAAARIPTGVALNGAAINQPISVLRAGPVTIGATLTAGLAYYLSDTPGGICPVADVGSAENVVLIGLATSTTVLDVDIQVTGVTL